MENAIYLKKKIFQLKLTFNDPPEIKFKFFFVFKLFFVKKIKVYYFLYFLA